DVVIRRQLRVGHVPGEADVCRAQRRYHVVEHREIFLVARVRPHEYQPRSVVEATLVGVEITDDVFDPLVRNHSSEKDEVRAFVVEAGGDQRIGSDIEVGEIGDDG